LIIGKPDYIVVVGGSTGNRGLRDVEIVWYFKIQLPNEPKIHLMDDVWRFGEAQKKESQLTLGTNTAPSFCGMLPSGGMGVLLCIRALQNSNLNIDTCSHPIEFIRSDPEEFEKQMNDILSGKNSVLEEAITSTDTNTVLSAIQAACSELRAFVRTGLTQAYKTPQFTEKMTRIVENVKLVSHEQLLPLSSALEAIATVAEEITFTTVNRIRSKLVE
uniref:DUF913 domain-containing protein n=1 Tax=Hydatigena taeniaeformis TaxID=6205 RepID=A0A0R3X8W5_HYDTA